MQSKGLSMETKTKPIFPSSNSPSFGGNYFPSRGFDFGLRGNLFGSVEVEGTKSIPPDHTECQAELRRIKNENEELKEKIEALEKEKIVKEQENKELEQKHKILEEKMQRVEMLMKSFTNSMSQVVYSNANIK